ncbi:MAG: peptidoglycan recognition family protein [Roseiflexaceae bacterium]
MPDFPTQGTPPFINRMLSAREWADYVAAYNFGAVAPSRLVLHHTYIPSEAQWRGLSTLQGIQRYYAGLRWSAGPHLFVGPDGIWLATPMKDIGIHAGTGNSGTIGGKLWYSIGLEMVGYFDRERPKGAVWEHAKAVMGGLSKRLGIAPRQLISFHRDYTNQKSCPGWAITKPWVFAEVEAWLNNQAPPPPPPVGPIGTPAPEVEQLIELLMGEGYKRRGQSYHSNWAFHQYAVQNGLGFPIGPNTSVAVEGKTYAYQPFARDTLYSEAPNWGDVRRLSELLAGSIPPAGLGRTLLEATYRAGGAALRSEWAFHQQALSGKLGPPLGESTTITVDGAQYSYQAFALDTLYNLVPNWGDVRRLSALAETGDPAQQRLRDALLAATYGRSSVAYRPEWAFHQLARKLNLGAPLSDSYRVTQGGTEYAIQVYATDILYNIVPNWGDVRRLSTSVPVASATLSPDEAPTESAVGGGRPDVAEADMWGGDTSEPEGPPDLSALLSADAVLEPAPAPFHILQFAVPTIAELPYGSRSGSRISLLVLHGDPGPALGTLAAMRALGSRSSTHYYVTRGGQILQVVPDHYAAWHTGTGLWRGRRQNINRISLGLTIERGPEGYSEDSLQALAWLVSTLRQRYNLPPEALVRAGDLNPRENNLPNFPWDVLMQRLRPGGPL